MFVGAERPLIRHASHGAFSRNREKGRPAPLMTLTSHGGERGERSGLVKDARSAPPPAAALRAVLDKARAVSPIMLRQEM